MRTVRKFVGQVSGKSIRCDATLDTFIVYAYTEKGARLRLKDWLERNGSAYVIVTGITVTLFDEFIHDWEKHWTVIR